MSKANKSLKNSFLRSGLIEKIDKGRHRGAFNLCFIHKYGRKHNIINVSHYRSFHNKFFGVNGLTMTDKDKQELFDTLTKIMVAVERCKIDLGIV